MKKYHVTIAGLATAGLFVYHHRAAIAAFLYGPQAHRRPAGPRSRVFASPRPPIFGRA